MMSDHGERKIDTFFWLLIGFAVVYLIGHLVVAFTRDAFPPGQALQPVAQASTTTAAQVTTSSATTTPVRLVWDRLADCESGEWDRFGHPIPGTARWDDESGPYEGGVHWLNSTWLAAGGGRFARHASDATREEQIEIADSWLARTSWAQWPLCSRKIGARS